MHIWIQQLFLHCQQKYNITSWLNRDEVKSCITMGGHHFFSDFHPTGLISYSEYSLTSLEITSQKIEPKPQTLELNH